MWWALLSAVLTWVADQVRRQFQSAGQDGSAKPGLRERLNERLAAWKERQAGGQ